MDGHVFVDFINLLPVEILEQIFRKLIEEDSKSLTNCRLVCKNWDAIISSSPRLWETACQKLGLDVKKTPEVHYKSVFLKMRKRLHQMRNGNEFLYVENITRPDFDDIMHYHNGILAIRVGDFIQFWELEPNLRFVAQVDMEESNGADCVCFDNSYLVVWTNEDHVITYKLPTMEKLYSKTTQTFAFKRLKFNTDIDLLVTASGKIVTFRCLSSGELYFTRTIDGFCVENLHLTSTPSLQNGCDYMLLCTDTLSCHKFNFDSQQIAADRIYHSVIHECPESHSFYVSFFTNPFLYVLCMPSESDSVILAKCDTVSGQLENVWEINCNGYDHYNLIAVGRKYAVLLRRSCDSDTLMFVIYDLATKSEFASLAIPGVDSYVYAYVNCPCCPSWLDGLDGFNDKGVFFVLEIEDGTFYVFKWL